MEVLHLQLLLLQLLLLLLLLFPLLFSAILTLVCNITKHLFKQISKIRNIVDTVPHKLPTTHNNDSVNVKMISSIVKLFSEMLFVFICPSLSRNKAVFIVNKLHNIYITRLNLKSLEKAIQTFVCDKILSSFLCNLLFHSLVLYDFP